MVRAVGMGTTNTPGAAFDRYLDERFPDRDSRAALESRVRAVKVAGDLMKAIDEMRHRRGVSRAAVAERMGKDPATLSRLLNNPSPNPTMATVLDLLEVLDVYLRVDVRPQPQAPEERHALIEIRPVE